MPTDGNPAVAILPDKPHRPQGTPPRCKACGGITSTPGELCLGCCPGPGGSVYVWASIIDYAYGQPPVLAGVRSLNGDRA